MNQHGGELLAVARRRDAFPVCDACPGYPRLSESSDVQMFPPFSHAASLVPSLEDVMSHKAIESLDVHVSPESVDVQTSPSQVAAASLVPSLDDVMRHHLS